MSPYRDPADRPLGPRWGVTWWRKLYVRITTASSLWRALRRERLARIRDARRLTRATERLLAEVEQSRARLLKTTEKALEKLTQ